MARIRTLNFLPEIFQTPTNAEFLAATLDQIVNPSETMRIQGYVGSKLGYGINAKDYYVVEPTKTRTDYQLDPGVVFTKPNESVAQDFISYPGILDAINVQGGVTQNNARLFQSQFYSWDSFTNLDKLINFNQYYWLPVGPPAVTVGAAVVYSTETYKVTSLANAYNIVPEGSTGSALNPTLTLLRGGVYSFGVSQNSQFWIQTLPGTSGVNPAQTNVSTREVWGVSNNGATSGIVTFAVPQKDAQDQFNFPGNNTVDVVSTMPFSQVDGVLLSELGGIDGVTSLDGLTVMFYNTGEPNEIGYVNTFFGETNFDVNSNILVSPLTLTVSSCDSSAFTLSTGNTSMMTVGQTVTFDNPVFGGITAGQVYYVSSKTTTDFTISETLGGLDVVLTPGSGSMTVNINQGLLEEGFYTNVSENFYTITYVGDPNNPVLRLIPTSVIPNDQRITPTYGTQWVNRGFYRNNLGVISLIPQITAPLDTLYYQDGTSPNKVGIIRIIENNATNTINVELDILGKPTYTSPNNVVFTNGLKVQFDGDVVPASYLQGEYYVEGVGTSIQLIATDSLVSPENFTQGSFNPYDIAPFDIGNFDSDLYVPVEPDYITIARNSISKNAWSRSNRWFHTDVISATATYNNNPEILNQYATAANKAKRPIIEFYPNLKLFNSGSYGKKAVDFYDNRATDALSNVAGSKAYYPDVETFTTYSATIAPVISGTSTTITVDADKVTGTFQIGMYVGDTDAILPVNSQITNITGTTTLTITVAWENATTLAGVVNASIVGTDTAVDNYALFPGARIVFGADADVNIRNKIFVADLVSLTPSSDPVIVLELAEDSTVLADEQVVILRGYNYQGFSFYFDGVNWIEAQQKITVNQPPLFDIFDANGVSFGDTTVYKSSSFTGNKLFAYGIGAGVDDPILGFPVRYSSIDNVGDISFDVSFNLDTFDYVKLDTIPENQKVNTGYVYDYTDRTNFVREIGWQTAIAPSTQYQVFSFDFDPNTNITSTFTCDIAATADLAEGETGWPRIQVYNNNEYVEPTNYTVTRTNNSTTITFNTNLIVATVIQVLLLSDQVSQTAYYSIPINLNNNPLNADLTTASVGDIRQQYRDIFINAPNTTGEIFGPNNYRDCGDLISYGTKIIQNSASLALPGAFLRKQDHSLFNALMFNSREYIKFKQLLVDTVQNTDYVQRYLPAQILDMALDAITSAKSQSNAFFWSDMLPTKAPYRSNTYTFANNLDTSIYPLTKVYNFSSANYDGVLVYLSRSYNGNIVQKQLTRGVDYIVSTDSPSLTVTLDLVAGDKITINEYNQTYGSYVPNTPSKLGLYPVFEPSVVLDSDYTQPTYFIKGHDGSYTKLYGDYDAQNGILVDFRDQALLEFELRVYNNIKLSTEVPINFYEVLPGYFRDPTYSWNEWLQIYSTTFLDWIGQNRLDYKTQFYNTNNQYTYNYTNSGNKLDRSPIQQGYWRGIYQYFYDTVNPNTAPWEMLGFTVQPSWWTDRYGPAPYTSDNGILWGDLEAGLIWNNGDSYIVPELARPGLSQIIPVDSNGNLVSPLVSIVGNYNPSTFQKDWKVGDDGPVELSYRRSSSYPFDLMRIFALTRPAEFYNLAVDLDNYKYNAEFNQYLVNNRSHLIPSNIEIYGNGTAKTSYINWIVDYEKQQGVDATTNIKTMLENLDVRLVYRLAGFSDKTLLKFYVEKGSPNSRNASLLIPDESYSVLLYDNQPYNRLNFSGVIVQYTQGGWTVYGNSQNFAYFTTLVPKYTGSYSNLTVQNATVKITNDYYPVEANVPYGTKFYSYQEVAQFLSSYGAWLTSKGMIFDEVVNGLEFNWNLMIQEFLYWIQTGWQEGSVITLNPAATTLKINKESQIVQPLTVQQQNFILNQDAYPIQLTNLAVLRSETLFQVNTLNQGDSMAYAQFNMSNFEHGIVFDNITLFNDIIYNLTTGLRQNRITVRGAKSAAWNGTINASGFILNQDNVKEWTKELKYVKGEIVKYKNKYWSALEIIQPSAVFEELKWKLVDYNDIQKGMLPNASTRAYESTLYYNTDKANLEQDADLLSYSLIGYRPRDYLALADLTDITQINVYKNMIKNKGTRNATYAFKGANLPQGGIDYNIYENWAIKSGEYGGVLNENFVEFRVNQNNMTGNPSIVSLTNGTPTLGTMQEIPLYSLFNYGTAITTPNILNTLPYVPTSPLYPNAGYVNFNDVKMSSYYFAGLSGAVNATGTIVPISQFYVRDYLWMANFKDKWGTYAFKPIGQITQVVGNLNGTATVTFKSSHNLSKLDPLAIINFAAGIDGYYIVTEVLNINQVIINLSIPNNTTGSFQGQGIGLRFISQRVDTPADIASLDLLEAEFTKNTVWVDENSDGDWAVYRKSINYALSDSLTVDNSTTYGSAVAYDQNAGYLIGDPGAGVVYRYQYNAGTGAYDQIQTITEGTSFGTKIVYANNIYVISEPTGANNVYIYVLNDTTLTNQLEAYQTIAAPGGVTDWGTEIAISGDSNWIYVSDLDNVQVYVYRKNNINLDAGYFTVGQTYVITSVGSTDFTLIGAVDNQVGITFVATGAGTGTGTATQVTYQLSTIIDGTVAGAIAGDGFGSAMSTNYTGDTLVVGAPETDYSGSIINWGKVYVYQRTVQNVEIQTNSLPNSAKIIPLAWTPVQTAGITADEVNSDYIHCSINMSANFAVNDPVVFTGTVFGDTGLEANTVYYIHSIGGGGPVPTNRNIKLKSSRSSTTALTFTNEASLSINVNVQTTPLYVTVNGTLVDDSNYGIENDTLIYTTSLLAGDIVQISDGQLNCVQTLTSLDTTRGNNYYSYALDLSKYGSNLLVGSPFEIDSNNREGIVYGYTNGGQKYGVIIGTSDCNVTGNTPILLNGYLVNLTAGNASGIAATINSTQLTNIQASASDGKLIIQLVNNELAQINSKLTITVFDDTTLGELGFDLYTQTQTINCPHEVGATQFGKAIKFNEFDSVVIGAPAGTRFVGTTFDFTDDENLDNDTVFDNNATRFVDSYANAGAVYMYDYLGQYNESLLNPGAFVYAQAVDSNVLDYGNQPMYGAALDFNNNSVIIGAPDFFPALLGGQATIYTNAFGVKDWAIYRQSAAIVDIAKIQNTQIFSAETNNTLINLDYIDPLQGKLLGAVRQNIDIVSSVDPARYNSLIDQPSGNVWGAEHVGRIWFNTGNVRWVNYHQNDVVYNSKYWGALFPGSDVAVYTWVASNVPPAQYEGPGVVLDVNSYAVSSVLNASNVVVPVYYFWARNTSVISEKLGKTLSDTTLASYIANPQSSGIAYMTPLLPNTFAMYNCYDYFNANDSVFHIGFANGVSNDVAHNEFTLIRENYADDFLPGIPNVPAATHFNATHGLYPSAAQQTPDGLYARLLDSLSGCDPAGAVVPNPFLPKAVQSGVLARPKQSFFYNRFEAIKNYLTYANDVLAQFPIMEIRPNATYLYKTGEYFDTSEYWQRINWWAAGYDNNTKAIIQVPEYADLAGLDVAVNTLVTVEQNGAGFWEIYRYDGDNVWTRIGLQNGTIEFKIYLWNYRAGNLGFGGDFFDTTSYDLYPSEETRNIVRALTEQIYIGDLLIYRNKSLILLFEYIQSETTESQNFLPWLSKTSLVDVDHTIRELLPYEVFKSDNQDFLAGYINEVKPYHVVIKEFVFKYTGLENYEGAFTDFDVPATYNTTYQKYISPQLVYGESTNEYEYSLNNSIWSTSPYYEWINSYGVSLVGQNDYQITTLASYLTLGINYIVVDNAQGFPINGVITIGDEQISYSSVDRALNVLSGLIRGLNNTTVKDHIPGEKIYIDLPAVVVLDGGRGYSNPPKVTAYIDTSIYPEPRVPAQLEAVMTLDTVNSIRVINPGEGYAVLPEIRIAPAVEIYFSNTDINSVLHTIKLYAPNLNTGDLVQFRVGTNGVGVSRLVNKQWYYVNVLESTPSTIIALYSSYEQALKDHDRILISDIGSSNDISLATGAKASAISSALPVRENITTIKFDRTTYNSQVIDWRAGAYYGAFFAGAYLNSEAISSSSIQLESTQPDINTILASAQGVAFEIVDVENDQQLTWSSFVRYIASTEDANNSIRLIPQDGNNDPLNPEPNASGTTIGFYVGMPIKFKGAVIGGLVDNTIYYVKEILNDLDFTISDTDGGAVKVLSDGTVGAQILECFVGEVTNTAVLTVNYPGILTVTATAANTNKLTVPLTLIGTGGTSGFYTNLPVMFTEGVFGGVIANRTYYVTTVVDDQTFTMSETENSLSTTVTETIASTDRVVVESTEGLSINDPIIFTGSVFGNIVAGVTYYVSEVVSSTELTISTQINGIVFALSNATGSATLTSQVDTVTLTTATGAMIMNVSLPVSPGQINGQLFTLYGTSEQYPGINTGTVGNLIERTINATIGDGTPSGVNRIAIKQSEGGTAFFYENMPLRVNTNIDVLVTGTTYYIIEYSGMEDPLNPGEYFTNIEITVASTSSTGNLITCDTTESLYDNMPIVFTGESFGNIVISQVYYVKNIVNGTQFTISEAPGGTTFVLSNASGSMKGTGDPYIVVSTSIGGSAVNLTTDTAGSSFTQFITGTPTFDISYILGGYRAIITSAGSGFAVNNTISILGTEVGGVTPGNDITLTVNTIDTNGEITDVICSGLVPGVPEQYYLKVISPTQLAVYSNSLMTVPVSGIDFPFTGFTVANVTGINSGTDALTIADTSIFNENDAVVFTGDTSEGVTNITEGVTYYILNILTPTTFTISTVPGDAGTIVNMVTTTSVNFTMAKAGSFALLPEPFFFNQSIVRFNNRVYVCVVSNNDQEFVIGKWELLDSGDRRLNAMDRVIGYYQPTVNMPGVDLTQLFEGVTYPNPIYRGNAFEPDQQFEVDTLLQDQPFYPTDVDLASILWNGERYIAAANFQTYSATIDSILGDTWAIDKISNAGVGVSDIIFAGGLYVMTSTNSATPVFRSNDGIVWTTNGYFTPYGTLPYDDNPYDMTSISIATLALNSVAYYNGYYVAVGENIVRSSDTYIWSEVTNFTPALSYNLYGIAAVNLPAFTGFIAVGKGKRYDYSSGLTEIVDTDLILYSETGEFWTEVTSLTSKGLYGIASDGTTAIAVGESGVIYYSQNAANWLGLNEVGVISVNSVTDQLNLTNTTGFNLNDPIRFSETFSTITAGVTYYVKNIVSTTQIQISTTPGGSVYALTDDAIPSQTLMYAYDALDPTPATLRDIIYANSIWLAVGDNGVIKTSVDGITWTTQTSGTTENLKGIAYNNSSVSFIVVGENNTIIISDDNGVTWTSSSLLTVEPTLYDVKGNDFLYGYGPEELVPGLISDNLSMTVTTRPGTNWPVTVYGHTGFRVNSIVLEPTSGTQTDYSFKNVVANPAQIYVQIIDPVTSLGTTLSQSEYTVDWINKIVVLNTPIAFSPVKESLRIDVYEVGNGDQIVKASTDYRPIRTNATSGFNEIYLNCNYSVPIYQGSGVIKPSSYSVTTRAYETEATTNRILCDSVTDFVLNQQITFQGVTFGNILEDAQYYVKSISTATNSITVSASYNPITGVAGPTFILADATGEMYVNIQVGNPEVWTDPIVYHNGTQLVSGTTGIVTRTKSSNNGITTSTTAGLIPGTRIMFCQCMFGNDITPFTTYYIRTIIDGNEFTISTTLGGPILPLSNGTGGAMFITNDYAFMPQANSTQAKMVFANNTYTNTNDYIVYSIFGETQPSQYGFTLPQVQEFTGDGANNVFTLNNFVGGNNPNNAIVEINGVRQTLSQYTISFVTDDITFVSAPASNDVVSVLTYNDTDRQYLNTQYNMTGYTVAPISTITNAIAPPIATTYATSSTAGAPNEITVNDTTGFVVDQTVQFFGTSFDANIAVDGTVYFVDSIVTGTTFTIKDYSGNVIVTAGGAGNMQVVVGGNPAIRVTTTIQHNLVENNLIRIDGTSGSVQLNGNTYYAKIISPYTFDLYTQAYDPTLNAVNYPVTFSSTYTGGGYIWKEGSFFLSSATATATTTGTNKITVDSTSSLVEGTPVYFSEIETVNGTMLMGNIVQGTEYFVRQITSSTEFTISATRDGAEFALTNDTGTINVIQWSQTDVNRLWVTINGLRVPSESLKIYVPNEIGILSEIVSGDEVIITSMIPTATPNQEIYINTVNNIGDATVYRVSNPYITWLTQPVYDLSTQIYVKDVTKLAREIIQTEVTPAAVSGYYYFGLTAEKNLISGIKVYNQTTSAFIDAENYELTVVDLTPTLRITAGSYINVGDTLIITTLEGNTIYINGEQIRFGSVDFVNNSVGNLQRGVNGTAKQALIPALTNVYGLLSVNKLPDVYYNQTWNSSVYNTTDGDPLQISTTLPATFLNSGEA